MPLRLAWWLVLAASPGVAAASPAASPGIVQDESATRAELLALRREIARHDELYFRRGAPEISDFEYDELKRRLRALEAAAPDAGGVGDDRTGAFPVARHGAPMLSLDKAHTDEELGAFHARIASRLGREDVVYRVEPKYDGIAVSLTYEHGRLLRVVTRGDGSEGDDLTANARVLLPALPARLSASAEGAATWPARVEVRGEVFMSLTEFARLNAEREAASEALHASPRNLAVGTLRTHDPADVAGRRLELVCFGWGVWERGAGEGPPETLASFAAWLAERGLPVAGGVQIAEGRAGMLAAVAAARAASAAGDFPTDGVVVKLERVADQHVLGVGPAGPRWAVARKFEPERASTRLLGITWQVGRTGVLTPVAELDPVALGGATVARATLHNADEIARRDLRVGDTVWVARAGEIIPAIVGVDKTRRAVASQPYDFPDTCPACAAALAREDGRAAWRCVNAACPAQAARRIAHWASPSALDLRGLGPALIDKLVAGGAVRGPADLYRDDAAVFADLGSGAARRLREEIAASRARAKADGARLLTGLGLPGVGRESARKLAESFGGLAELAQADEARLRAAGLGRATAQGVAEHLARAEVRAEFAALLAAGLGETWETSGAAGVFAGQTVVVTGRLARWTRAEVEARLAAAGARVASDVTAATTLVVAGEAAGSAREQARKRGVEIIDEAELVRRLEVR